MGGLSVDGNDHRTVVVPPFDARNDQARHTPGLFLTVHQLHFIISVTPVFGVSTKRMPWSQFAALFDD